MSRYSNLRRTIASLRGPERRPALAFERVIAAPGEDESTLAQRVAEIAERGAVAILRRIVRCPDAVRPDDGESDGANQEHGGAPEDAPAYGIDAATGQVIDAPPPRPEKFNVRSMSWDALHARSRLHISSDERFAIERELHRREVESRSAPNIGREEHEAMVRDGATATRTITIGAKRWQQRMFVFRDPLSPDLSPARKLTN